MKRAFKLYRPRGGIFAGKGARAMAAVAVTVAATAATIAAIAVPGIASAQGADKYPSHPIRLIVPFGAGGGTDIQARIIAQEMGKVLGQTVVVENRPGAGGNIGAAFVAQSKPDGYTLLVGSTGTHGANQFLYSKLPYDPVKDFTPITLLATFDNVVVVPESSKVHTLKELVDAAKANPGKLNYGVTTVGSSSHLAVEKFNRDAGIKAGAVPYNGAGQATTDLLAGRLDYMLDLVGTQIGNIQAGKVRPIATTALKRNAVLPNVPTIAESGYPGFSAVGWVGLFGPAGMPKAAVDTLYKAIEKVYASPDFQATMRARSFDIAAMPPAEYAKFLENERKKWGTVVRESNIKLD
ncbi:Bug family tripartite tricarboxylate transporter substrate binding protein [Bordetella sp. H567]|uniref:Bug family tripartite tricarboxylate transporter substrate binding protein n=1 Tax=Bordetella sp. H567 TaxID=1697043 RepID=UPI0009F626DD|nr:tripartite tricarboxylate transporter substrate binding protein [Bordetella sp. H567]